jgi:hypothetical protein
MDDIEVLASYSEIEKPAFHGVISDSGRDMALGEEIIKLMQETKVLGPFRC